jgi:hypothetical protein
MEFTEAKNEIEKLRAELAQVEIEYKNYQTNYNDIVKKMRLCESRKKDLSKEIERLETIIESEDIYANVSWIEGFETLTPQDLIAISTGMDQTDYRKIIPVMTKSKEEIPRWYDLERLVKEVIEFKKHYPGWILDRVIKSGQYDTLPPQTFYKFTYNTPHGHYMSFGGIEILQN